MDGVPLDTRGLWLLDAASDTATAPPPSPDEVADIEAELGVRLPQAWVDLATRERNGGRLRRTVHPSPSPTSWAEDHVAVTTLFSISRHPSHGIAGASGQSLWLGEWGYPPIGVYLADCPSAGHDLIALDYRSCGPDGEPPVVHVDQEWDHAVTVLAPSFADFINGLVEESALDGR